LKKMSGHAPPTYVPHHNTPFHHDANDYPTCSYRAGA